MVVADARGQPVDELLPALGLDARVDAPVTEDPHPPLQHGEEDEHAGGLAGGVQPLGEEMGEGGPLDLRLHPVAPQKEAQQGGKAADQRPENKDKQVEEKQEQPQHLAPPPEQAGGGESCDERRGQGQGRGGEQVRLRVAVAGRGDHDHHLAGGARLHRLHRRGDALLFRAGEKLFCQGLHTYHPPEAPPPPDPPPPPLKPPPPPKPPPNPPPPKPPR